MYNPQESQDYEVSGDRPLAFCDDALRKVSWSYVIWLILAGIVSFVVYYFTRNSPLASVRPALWVYYVVFGIHVVLRLKKGGLANVLAPDILFLTFYTLFHLGYVALFDLGMLPYSDPPFVFESSIPKSLFVVNLGMISFIIGYEILGSKGKTPERMSHIKIPSSSWCIMGLVCMIIAIFAHLFVLVRMAPQYRIYGYPALQRITDYADSLLVVLFWRYSLHLMSFGLVVHLVSSALRYGKLFRSKIALIAVIVFFILVIMEGDRGPIVKLGVPILLVRHYFIKRVKLRYLIGIGVGLLILFSAMGVVRSIVFQPAKMLQEYQYQKEAGTVTWMNPFIEMGGSFQVVNITTHEVPISEPYWRGASWRDAVIHIVPFLQGFTTRLGISKWAPSDWITVTYFGTGRAGRAFTVAAEGFLNFGFAGVIIELMFLGMFTRWLTIRFSRSLSPAWGIIMLGCLGILILVTRNHIILLFAPCAQIMALTWFLNLFLGSESPPMYGIEEDIDLSEHEETLHTYTIN